MMRCAIEKTSVFTCRFYEIFVTKPPLAFRVVTWSISKNSSSLSIFPVLILLKTTVVAD